MIVDALLLACLEESKSACPWCWWWAFLVAGAGGRYAYRPRWRLYPACN